MTSKSMLVDGGNQVNKIDENNMKENITKKRKDPKSMSVEELDEYIQRNKSKIKIDDNNKSLNSSFHSQKNLNYSFNETSKVLNKINDNFKKSDNEVNSNMNIGLTPNSNMNNSNVFQQNKSINQTLNNSNINSNLITNKQYTESLGLNYNYLNMNQNQNQNLNNSVSNNNNLNNVNNQNINNPFINTNSPYQNMNMNYQNVNTQSSYDPMSDGDDKYFKYKQKSINNAGNLNQMNTSFQNQNLNQNSTAASNYLKALQDKIKELHSENEELKKNFIQVSELIEKVLSYLYIGKK